MKNKAQSIGTVAFIVGTFLIIWALALAPMLSYWGHEWALQTSGTEAFLVDNINLWIFFGVVVFTAIGAYAVTNQ
jgi:hypothetical protein